MAININSLEELKQIFKEQEENDRSHQKAQAEADRIKAERLKLDQQKQAHKERTDRERLKLLQEKEERAKAKEQARAEQVNKDNYVYLISILASFGAVLTSFILFLVILFKF